MSVDKHCFWTASQTVGASLRFKNSGHMITFLWLCGLQNTDHVMLFWLFLRPLKADWLSHVSLFFVERPEEGKMSFVVQFKICYRDNFK